MNHALFHHSSEVARFQLTSEHLRLGLGVQFARLAICLAVAHHHPSALAGVLAVFAL
jgi:hypothetical protein